MEDPSCAAPGICLPPRPVQRFIDPITRFLHVQSTSGIVLLVATAAALVLANSPLAGPVSAFWKTPVGLKIGSIEFVHSLRHWINDGLMALFFFVVGLEVKREIAVGELRELRLAALPIAAALGGMVVPAGIYLLLQGGGPAARGWGIPMATDIAFVVGCLALMGPRIPRGLRVLLLSLAIADDLGAILVIAIGYTAQVHLLPLACAAAGVALILLLSRLGVRSLIVFVPVGTAIWLGVHESGVHATIAGVALGLITPARPLVGRRLLAGFLEATSAYMQGDDWKDSRRRYQLTVSLRRAARETVSPLERIETALHPWVSYAIMPLFAFANAGVAFEAGGFADPVAVAVIAGLGIGKPVGIFLFSRLAVVSGLARLPEGVGWRMLFGGGVLAGIGFTMALFIAGLALEGAALEAAKVGILAGSLASALCGMVLLHAFSPRPTPPAGA
ncbi:MAG: Na+/H+ antiporter NhaA [Desulfobacterales bacterium]|jgi:NhaA family Na+:H+ antiporter|nr:Na+/H+ antiporter NhaA [Desulfobacterales bacterium]